MMTKAILFLCLLCGAEAFATQDFVLFFCGRVSSSAHGQVDYTTNTLPMSLTDGEKTYLSEWSMDSDKNWGRCASFKGTATAALQLTVSTIEASWIDDADSDCGFTAAGVTQFRSDIKEINPGESVEVKTLSTSLHVYYATLQDRTGDIAANAEKYCKSR